MVSVLFQATRDPICCVTATDKTLIVVYKFMFFVKKNIYAAK